MKFAACFLLLSAGVYSAAPADEPHQPTSRPHKHSPPRKRRAARKRQPPSSAGDAKPAPGASAAAAPKADKSEVVNVARHRRGDQANAKSRITSRSIATARWCFAATKASIGSHFQRTHCSTLKQLKDAELSGKEYVISIQQQGSAVPFKGPWTDRPPHYIRTITASRYVTPLREGGSLPAIIEADDDGLYVLKFRGAGQGPKALIAEHTANRAARGPAHP